MKNKIKYILITLLLFEISLLHAKAPIKLSEGNYNKYGKNKAILVMQINWGRNWNCGGYENAQLQNMAFIHTKKKYTLNFKPQSNLSSKNQFLPYAFIIEPGKYALSDLDIKVAKSSTDVKHLHFNKSKLIKNGKAIGGTFQVKKNEIVYIGSFGLDCYEKPILWRYYIEDKGEFNRFIKGLKEEYPYIRSLSTSYRLFSTKMFGQ